MEFASIDQHTVDASSISAFNSKLVYITDKWMDFFVH